MATDALKMESWSDDLPTEWRTMRSVPSEGPYNMAVDSALLEAARHRGFGVWRTYAWSHPTLSFGRNESVRAHFDAASLASAGLRAVRRPTGGRVLLHAEEVTYSVALPLARHVPWTAAYSAVNHVLLTALRSLGAPAELAKAGNAPLMRPDGPLCFDQPAPGEIVVQGAKLVGSAVWRARGAYLQHGSILLEDHQDRVRTARKSLVAAPSPAATLSQCVSPPPTWNDVASALERALRETVSDRHDGRLATEAVPLDARDVERHEVLFRDPNWLWRL